MIAPLCIRFRPVPEVSVQPVLLGFIEISAVVGLNLWYRRRAKRDRVRRTVMTPEERKADDTDDWCSRQW